MLGRNFSREVVEIAGRRSVGRKCSFGVVVLHPSVAPIGAFATWEPSQCRAHGKFVIPRDHGCSRMVVNQLEDQIDGSPGVGATINQIAYQDDPPMLIVRERLESSEYGCQFLGMTMHITDDCNRAMNLRLQY